MFLGYKWSWVNHDRNYVDPETGDHTNKIESSWFAVKRQLPRVGKYDLKRYLCFIDDYSAKLFLQLSHNVSLETDDEE